MMNRLSQAEDGRPEVLTRRKTWQLLNSVKKPFNPFIRPEEQRHPWSVDANRTLHSPLLDFPLLRAWDHLSGSQPEEDNRMLSRSPGHHLSTEQARKTSLANHLHHRIWEPTPYISFTRSPTKIEEIVAHRSQRPPQSLTVIDPNARLNNGLPILDVLAEMEHYDIQDPYNQENRYYIDHYLCLWEVTNEEIVKHYKWEELAQHENWYEDVIMPDFLNFRRIVSAPARMPFSIRRLR